MAFAILILEAFLFSYIDRKHYGTRFTPISVLTFPFIGLIILNLIWGSRFGFVELYIPSLWYWVIGVLFFWVGGNLISSNIVFKISKDTGSFVVNDLNNKYMQRFLMWLSIVFLIIIYSSVFKSGLLKFEGVKEETRVALGLGVVAHVSILLRIPVIYFMVISKFKRQHIIYWMIVLLWMGYSILYNKSSLAIPFLAGLIGRYIIYKERIKLRTFIYLTLFAILLFWAYYSINFGMNAPKEFLKNHLVFYLNAGLLANSEYIKQGQELGINWQFLYQPIFNVINKVLGQDIELVVSDLWIKIDQLHPEGSNVKTFFGSIYIYGGWIMGSVTCIVWGAISYLSLAFTKLFHHIFFFLGYILILGTLFFGWFDLYFNALSYYEITIFWLIIVIADSLIFKNGKLTIYNKKE